MIQALYSYTTDYYLQDKENEKNTLVYVMNAQLIE